MNPTIVFIIFAVVFYPLCAFLGCTLADMAWEHLPCFRKYHGGNKAMIKAARCLSM